MDLNNLHVLNCGLQLPIEIERLSHWFCEKSNFEACADVTPHRSLFDKLSGH